MALTLSKNSKRAREKIPENSDALLESLHKELERRKRALCSTNDSPLGSEAIGSVQSAIEKKCSDYLHQRDNKSQGSIDNAKSQRNVKILERKAKILEQYVCEYELKTMLSDNQSERNIINQDQSNGVNLKSISILSLLFDYSKFLSERS